MADSDNVGSVFLELGLDGSKFTAGMKTAEDQAAASGASIGSMFDGVFAKLTSAFVAGGLIEKGFESLLSTMKAYTVDIVSHSIELAEHLETASSVMNILGNNAGYTSSQLEEFVQGMVQ